VGLKRAAVLTALVVTLTCLGCDSGTTTYNIDGTWSAGRVTFNFGGGQTWVLYDVLMTVDTTEGEIRFSGLDSEGLLWGYSGDYTRTQNRVVAQDMPEIDYGSSDQLDLQLEFSRNRFSGAAINWVYDDDDDLTDVGAARISGGRADGIDTRDFSPTEGERREPKFDE
jgi:hypothetical protein